MLEDRLIKVGLVHSSAVVAKATLYEAEGHSLQHVKHLLVFIHQLLKLLHSGTRLSLYHLACLFISGCCQVHAEIFEVNGERGLFLAFNIIISNVLGLNFGSLVKERILTGLRVG